MLDSNNQPDQPAADTPLAARHDLPQASSGRRPMLVTLMIASALSPLAINIFIPSMNSIAGDLEVSTTAIGLGLSLYLAATAAVQLVAGPLSDRFGRRPIILGGVGLFLVGTLLCLVAESLALFLLGRVIQAASATGIALSRAVVRDLYVREKAASMIGYVTMGFAVAPMIGPAIGGLIDTWAGWRAVFWLLGGVGALTMVLLVFDLSETNMNRGTPMRAQWKGYGVLLRTPNFWRYTGVSSLVSAVFFSFLGAGPFIAVQILGMTSAAYGLWFMLTSIGYISGNFVTGRLSQKVGLRFLMVAGSGFTLAGAVISLAAFALGLLSPLTLFAPMLIVGFGNGLALPSAIAGGISVRPEAAGAAAGLLGAIQIGVGAITTVIAAGLSPSPIATAVFMIALSLPGLVIALLTRRERPRP